MRVAFPVSLVVAALTLAACGDSSVGTADTVYTNGRIYTVDEAQPWAEAVAIKDGQFMVVGSNADVEAVTGSSTEVVDLAGGFAMPGLVDIHGFHGMSVENRVYCELKGTFWDPTEEQILSDLRDCVAEYPGDLEWFFAEGFTPGPMSAEGLSAATLDEIIPDRPAYIVDESGHNAWVNSRAFEAAGVTDDTPDPPLGFYERDASGRLTGRVFESAMNIFSDLLPDQDVETLKIGNAKFLAQATEKGLTSMGNAYNFPRHLQGWHEMKAADELQLHVVLYQDGNFGTSDLNSVESLVARYQDFDLPGRPGVKIGLDASVESGTSPMVDGYADPTIQAELVIEPEVLSAYVAELDRQGFSVKIHAIGDLAVRAAIDALEPVIRANGGNPNRHHIDHNSHVKPEDMTRLAELEIPASIWGVLNAPVAYNMDIVRPMLSEAQWARAYPNREMADAGVHLANHTDAPQANQWPWFGMEASVTRGYPGRPDVPPMGADQALTLEESVRFHTLNGAFTLRLDDVTGSIEVGKSADMILLNHNLFEIPETEIHETEVLRTLFKGGVVYERD